MVRGLKRAITKKKKNTTGKGYRWAGDFVDRKKPLLVLGKTSDRGEVLSLMGQN